MADGSASIARNRLAVAIGTDRAIRAQAAIAAPHAAATEIQGTRWRGASQTLRSMVNWAARVGSATADAPSQELRTLRARSRDAGRNHPVARAALVRSRTAIVGTGMVCRPSVDHEALGITPEAAQLYNTQLRQAFERWADDPAECDMEATLDFYGLQGLALLSALSSGDCFALTPMELRAGGVNELKLQLIEADRVCNKSDGADTTACIDGIQLRGPTPEGCWVRNVHPGDVIDTRMPSWAYYPFFDAGTGRRRVLHVWNDKERPGQVRGVPFLAPVLEPLKQIARLTDAELMASVLSSMLTVFIERAAEAGGEEDEEAVEGTDSSGNIALGNGAIVDLAAGEKANPVNPLRPNVNFDPFFMAVVKQIGAALEIPRDVLLLQFDASYSAARAAMLEAWRMFLTRRWWLVQQFCQPIYALLVDEEVAAGRLRLPGYDDPMRRRAWQRALWTGPAKGAMDEWKEANAAKTRIEIGVSNEQIETAAMTGEDRDTVYAQRVREVQQRKRDGLLAEPGSPGNATAATATTEPQGTHTDKAGHDDAEGVDDRAPAAKPQEETA